MSDEKIEKIEDVNQKKLYSYAAAQRRTKTANIVFDIIIYLTLIFVVVVTVYPFWNTIAISLNEGLDSLKGGIKLWPRKFTWTNYLKMTESLTRELFQFHVQYFRLFCAYSVHQFLLTH